MRMRTSSFRIAQGLGTLAAAVSISAPAAAVPSRAVLVLLDRSGSMVQPFNPATCGGTTSGTRRWDCAIAEAKTFLSGTDDGDPSNDSTITDTEYFLWRFRTVPGAADPNDIMIPPENRFGGSGPEGPLSLQAIQTRLDVAAASEGPSTSDFDTPLAAAYCKSLRFLLSRQHSQPAISQLDLKVESDGLENSSPGQRPSDLPAGVASPTDPFTPSESSPACAGEDSGSDFPFKGFGSNNSLQVSCPPGTPQQCYLALPGTNPNDSSTWGTRVWSWQANMMDLAISGFVHTPQNNPDAFVPPASVPGPAVISHVTFLQEFIQPAPLAARSKLTGVGDGSKARQVPRRAAAAASVPIPPPSAPSSISDLLGLFGGLTTKTGGRLTVNGGNSAPPSGDPTGFHVIEADINDDGCVNGSDFTLLQKSFGKAVKASTPETFAADANRDGTINTRDYFLLERAFGRGCATPPPPVPLLQGVLLSFEDLGNWSSAQGPVERVNLPRTDGQFALRVGGKNWREVNSIVFKTSTFQGVTSKIAFDIFIPPNPSNPHWLGQTQLFVSCPSANINNLPLGAVELTGKPLNKFSPAQFAVPSKVRTAMTTPHNDFSFRIVVNSNDPGYVIDNVRFVP